MAISRSITLLMIVSATISMALLNSSAMAANYIVGGPNGGWDATTDLQTWAASQSFQPGDNLIFQYAPSHDVVEVPKSDYDACQATTPIQSYTGGASIVPITSAGKRYFICGTPGHCSSGMKLEVNIVSTISPASPASAPEQSLSPALSLPFPTVESPAAEFPPSSVSASPLPSPELEIPVLGSSPALSPFPTGTSALTPPSVDSSSAEGNGFGSIQGIVVGLCSLVAAVIVVMG